MKKLNLEKLEFELVSLKLVKKKISKQAMQLTRKFVKEELIFVSDAVSLAKENFNLVVSDQTIRRILKRHRLQSLADANKPALSNKNILARFQFARTYKK